MQGRLHHIDGLTLRRCENLVERPGVERSVRQGRHDPYSPATSAGMSVTWTPSCSTRQAAVFCSR